MSGAHPGAGGSGTVADAHRALLISRRDDGTILHASDALCRLLGRTADEIVGRTPSTIGLASEARVDWVRQRAPVVGKGYRYTRELQTAAGPLLADVELYAAVIGGDEVIISTVEPAVAPDSASDADVLGLVLDQAPVGVVVYDRDLRIMRVTRRVEEMGRITPRHIGLRLEEAFPDVAAVFLDAIRQVFATGEPVVNMETTAPEHARSFLTTLFPIGGGPPPRWVGCIFTDVTDRVAAERALGESERRRREILASMLQAEEDERSRIATELHDDTVQVMTAALLAMDRVAMAARKAGSERLEMAVALARGTLEEATDRTRRLMFELRPAILHEQGLAPSLRLLADQTGREAGAEVHVECRVGRYGSVVEELVYRTVQEALANVRKHAAPDRVKVNLHEADGLIHGVVEDDGLGFDLERARRRPSAALHLGLDSLVERVRAAGGEAAIETSPGRGTRVEFSVSAGGVRAPLTRR